MDSTIYSALISSILLVMSIITARWALKGFRQSKQALREAASYVSVIVGALSSRIEALEDVSNQVRDAIGALSAESTGLRSSDANFESRCRTLEKSVEEIITKHNQILHELETLRSKPVPSVSEPRPVLQEDPILDRLTATERETLQILKEGPLHAPELGRRVQQVKGTHGAPHEEAVSGRLRGS